VLRRNEDCSVKKMVNDIVMFDSYTLVPVTATEIESADGRQSCDLCLQ